MQPLATAHGDYCRARTARRTRHRHREPSPSAPACATTIARRDSRPDDAPGPDIWLLAAGT